MHSTTDSIRLEIKAESLPGEGPDLAGYPGLTHALLQWGDGVRIASNGKPIEPIARAATKQPIGVVAADHGVSLNEVVDAMKYCQAHRLI